MTRRDIYSHPRHLSIMLTTLTRSPVHFAHFGGTAKVSQLAQVAGVRAEPTETDSSSNTIIAMLQVAIRYQLFNYSCILSAELLHWSAVAQSEIIPNKPNVNGLDNWTFGLFDIVSENLCDFIGAVRA